MKGVCTLCGLESELTFEHIPPKSSGNNKPTRLYSGIKTINSSNAPWDLSGYKYENAQRGNGGYYLCSRCNNDTGRWYVESFAALYTQAITQNITPFHCSQPISISWKLTLRKVFPLRVAKQILLMISCINGREFVKKNPEIEAILRNKNQRPKTINHSIALFVNGGALNVTYPLTGVMSLKGSSKTVTGFSFDPFGFQLQIDGGSASDQYANITSWLYDYEYNDQATLELCVPMFETNTVFPGMHKSKKEILRDRNNRL